MRAVSNVVALALVVSVAIVLAIAVSYLVSSLPQHSTCLEIVYAQAYPSGTPEIVVAVKNIGARTIQIIDVHLNEAPIQSQIPERVASISPDPSQSSIPIQPGEQQTITIQLNPSAWTGGETIQLTILTNTGHRYYAMVTLS